MAATATVQGLACLVIGFVFDAVALPPPAGHGSLNAGIESQQKPYRTLLRSSVNAVTLNSSKVMQGLASAPCQCLPTSPQWSSTTRTTPKCIFIDLGAADGNTFHKFMSNGFGPVQNCPSGDFEAFLVEANPRFNQPLQTLQSQYPNKVHSLSSTAAFMCEAQTSFYLDTTNHANNYWGSSLNSDHPDVQKSGQQKVTVPTMNLMRLLHEHTIPGDWVMVKMDIEGSEWDVLPCLANSPDARLIDRLYLEDHYHLGNQLGLGNTTAPQYEASKTALRSMHVDIPDYFSWQ